MTGSAPNQVYTFSLTGETIPHGALSYTQAPFVPHSSVTTIDNVAFTVSAYPTNVTGVAGAYRVTIVVSWNGNPPGWRHVGECRNGRVLSQLGLPDEHQPSVRRTLPAPSVCERALGQGRHRLSTAAPGWTGDPIPGVSVDSFELSLANTSSQVQVEQTSQGFR